MHALTVNTSDFDFEKLRERKLDLLLGRIMPQIDGDLTVETLFEEGLSVVVGQTRLGPADARWRSLNWQAVPGNSASPTMWSGLLFPRYSATMV